MGGIFGDERIVEVEHHVLFGLFFLHFRHIAPGDTALRIKGDRGVLPPPDRK